MHTKEDWTKKYIREKKRLFGFNFKPKDPMNEKQWGDLVSNLSGRRDLLDVIRPLPGDVWVCEDCLNKFASHNGLVLRPHLLIMGGEKCTFCGRDLWILSMRGKRVFEVKQIILSLPEIYTVLGKQKKKHPKVAGERLW